MTWDQEKKENLIQKKEEGVKLEETRGG